MIRLSKLTDYAMLIMSQMAKDPDSVLSAAVIAEALHLSLPTVSKILKILAEGGLVGSVRGVDGGYHLARSASEISVADVITAMEGNVGVTACCESSDLCAIQSMCTMKDNWRKINTVVYSLLAKLTICDMLKPLPQGLTWQIN
jgi:FeS assembly SUF system regulator